MKEGLIDICESKFGMWRRLPFSLIGLCHSDLAAPKPRATAALLECAAAPCLELVHRVALQGPGHRGAVAPVRSQDSSEPLVALLWLHSLATQ